jgi:hypothetical protein
MNDFAKLLKENAVLPLWPETGPDSRAATRGDLRRCPVGRHQDAQDWKALEGADRLAEGQARTKRPGGVTAVLLISTNRFSRRPGKENRAHVGARARQKELDAERTYTRLAI